MSNPEHVKWLLDGVQEWNARRTARPFTPDLTGVNVTAALLAHKAPKSVSGDPDLTNVNLSQANLADCDFSNCTLNLSSFKGADLTRTRFVNSNLNSADLSDAKLKDADLSSARLIAATLEKAYLEGCNLRDANIAYTNLIGANLTGSRPWQASMSPPITLNGDTQRANLGDEITGVTSLLNQISEIKQHYAIDSGPRQQRRILYYRGESKDTWKLSPRVMRPSEGSGEPLRGVEGELLVDLVARRPEDFFDATSALDQMVVAQHHGLPTRLLDVTSNPIVALFHASGDPEESPNQGGRIHVFAAPRGLVKPFNSDAISVVSNFARLSRSQQNLLLGKSKDETEGDSNPEYIIPERLLDDGYPLAMNRLYQFIRLEKPSFQERIDPKDLLRVFLVEPRHSFERIRAQSGAFLLSALYERFEETEVRKWSDDLQMYHHYVLAVPYDCKVAVREELATLNVTRETMFPGLDEAARAVTGPLWWTITLLPPVEALEPHVDVTSSVSRARHGKFGDESKGIVRMSTQHWRRCPSSHSVQHHPGRAPIGRGAVMALNGYAKVNGFFVIDQYKESHNAQHRLRANQSSDAGDREDRHD